MHPYRMLRLIKERAKDTVVNVARTNSVYQTIDRLVRAELIEVRQTGRAERRPERIVYAITERGRTTLREWLAEMLSSPGREFAEFPAALATAALLGPARLGELLAQRAAALAEQLQKAREDEAAMPFVLPRVVVLEDEYRQVVLRAELEWLRTVVSDIEAGRLNWSAAELKEFAAQVEDVLSG